jgi:hypothetical protein
MAAGMIETPNGFSGMTWFPCLIFSAYSSIQLDFLKP